jgi:acetyl-CoA decarbonylase/synthase complex subunit gamma
MHMPLTALDIYKVLPRTNCGECGVPTCLAFAMSLATKKAAIDACPYATDDAKATLAGAAAPPIRLVSIGPEAQCIVMGNETVLFRHEETFYHPTAIAVRIRTDRSPDELKAEFERVQAMVYDRVGQFVRVEMVALDDADGDPGRFAAAAALADGMGLALMLMSDAPAAMEAALAGISAHRPLADLTRRIAALGVTDLVLDSGARGLGATLTDLTQIRRLALRRQFRPLGYPAMAFVTAQDPIDQVTEGTAYLCKYAGLVVTDGLQDWQALAMVTARQNIYTDPQKPIQIEPGVRAIGKPDASSPVLITTNFSLTYFTVEADVEASHTAAWALIVDTEGQSVLTAWAADKFTAETIAKALAASDLAERVNHRKAVLPGGVATLSGKLEELSGWEIMVGPRESAGMTMFMRNRWRPSEAAATS